MNIEDIIKLGGGLGYSGEDLRDWVEQTVKAENERVEKERQFDREQKEHEAQLDRERVKDQQILIEKQKELEELRQRNACLPAVTTVHSDETYTSRASVVKGPRLPVFEENNDQIDSFLLRFERFAGVNQWRKEDWATHLSALLKGKALDVYSRLEDSDARDYDKVKEALLIRYNLTEDGLIEKFRKSRPENGERMGQFRTRIMSYLDKWIKLAGKDKSNCNEVMGLFVMEQLTNSCSKELAVFLKERKPKTSEELVGLAEKYVDAHGSAGAYHRNMPQPKVFVKEEQHNETDREARYEKPMREIKCQKCFKFGHFARDCRARVQVSAVRADIVCSYCRKRGHEVKECWTKQRDERRRPLGPRIQHVAVMEQTACEHYVTDELKCGCKPPVLSAACTITQKGVSVKMPIATGKLDGTPVTVLRDSGSSGVVVKKGLVDNRCRRADTNGTEVVVT